MSKPTGPRIVLLDIETFPSVGYVWSKWETNVIKFVQEKCIATVAYKVLGERETKCLSLPQFKGYRPGSYDDAALVKALWVILDDADIVIAHNGNSFDVKEIQGRFIYHKLPPPSPFKSIDTKILVKQVARYNSNKLDDLGQFLGEGKKIKTDFELWEGCIKGDKEAWAKMVKYNKQDVVLLEKIYLRLRPWASTHPNMGVYLEEPVCPKCGSAKVEFRGYARTNARKYRRFCCLSCGGWGRVAASEKFEKGKRPHTHAI